MPELPEVETVARSIAPLVGRRIVSAEFRSLRILRGGDPDGMAAGLAGRRIAGIKRYGKFLVMPLEGGGYVLIHLGAGSSAVSSSARNSRRGSPASVRNRWRFRWPISPTH